VETWKSGSASQPAAEVGVLIWYALRGRLDNGRESKRFVLAGYENQKCVLVMGLTGVLGARPTGRLYMCKCVL
jgi:hypothetical protein